MYGRRMFPGGGGLMGCESSRTGLLRRAAYSVDRVLKGAKPADLPVEEPMRFDFIINLNTAQAPASAFPTTCCCRPLGWSDDRAEPPPVRAGRGRRGPRAAGDMWADPPATDPRP